MLFSDNRENRREPFDTTDDPWSVQMAGVRLSQFAQNTRNRSQGNERLVKNRAASRKNTDLQTASHTANH